MSGEHPTSSVRVTGAQLARMLAEPGFAEALRASWRGGVPLPDAVQWRLEPFSIGPSGTPDPAGALAELKTQVYSRPDILEAIVEVTDAAGIPQRMRAGEARLLAVERRLAADADELDDAIETVQRLLRPTEPPGESAGDPAADPAAVVVSHTRLARMLRRRPALVYSAAAVLLLALVLPTTAVALAPSFAPSVMLLKVFNRPQSVVDIAPQVFTGGQPGYRQRVRDTTRFLGLYYGVRVFAFRDIAGQVCMLSTAPGNHDVTVCVSPEDFTSTGLTIDFTHYGVTDAAAGVTPDSRLAFQWGPVSDLTVRINPATG
jgi:hypothetical protein